MAFDRRETTLLVFGDLVLLTASLWAALLLRNLEVPSTGYFLANFVPFVPMFLLSLFVFYTAGLYEKQTRMVASRMGIRVFGAQLANVLIAAFLFFILPLTIAPKTILLLYLLVSVVAVSFWRFYRMGRGVATSLRTPALLIGSGPAVAELYEEIRLHSKYLLRFTQHLDTAILTEGELRRGVEEGIQAGAQAIVLDTADEAAMRDLPVLYGFMTEGIAFMEFSTLYEEVFDRVPLEHIGIDRILEALPRQHLVYDSAKRLFDLVLAAVLSLIALPFILMAALFLAFEPGSPFIFNERLGREGHPFRIVKLRTMLFNDRGDAELRKQNRVTRIGRLLRKSRIDELPQLWNVLLGDLSFIGPRPELPPLAAVYEREIPYYRLRHLIAPGLSGWAQIHDYDAPRGAADVGKTRRKLSYDLYYLKHRSFGLDLAIAIKTLRALTSFTGT